MKNNNVVSHAVYLIDVKCPHCGKEQKMIDSEFTVSWLLRCKDCKELFGNELKEVD